MVVDNVPTNLVAWAKIRGQARIILLPELRRVWLGLHGLIHGGSTGRVALVVLPLPMVVHVQVMEGLSPAWSRLVLLSVFPVNFQSGQGTLEGLCHLSESVGAS